MYVFGWMSAILAGMLLGWSYPPSGHGILAWIGLVPLLQALILPGTTVWTRARLGFVAGLVFAVLSLTRVEDFLLLRHLLANDWSGLRTFAGGLILTCGVVALPLTLYSVAVGYFLSIRCFATALVLSACLWTAVEYVSAEWISSNFARAALGHTIAPSHPVAQNADILGVYGLGFLVVCNNLAVHLCLTRSQSRVRWLPLLAVLLVTAVLFYRGNNARDFQFEAPDGVATSMAVSVLRLDGSDVSDALRVSVASLRASSERPSVPRILVWPPMPSTAAPTASEVATQLAARVKDTMNAPLHLVVWARSDVSADAQLHVMSILDPESKIENVSLQAIEANDVVTLGARKAEDQETSWALASLSREDLGSSSSARALSRNGADLLVASIDESSALTSNELALSYVVSAYRAIETRRWLIRCSNGGISAFIDPNGGSSWILSPSVYGDIQEDVSRVTSSTHFVSWGWLFAPLCCLVSILGLLRRACVARCAGSGRAPPIPESSLQEVGNR